jgi:hypothetical protein
MLMEVPVEILPDSIIFLVAAAAEACLVAFDATFLDVSLVYLFFFEAALRERRFASACRLACSLLVSREWHLGLGRSFLSSPP